MNCPNVRTEVKFAARWIYTDHLGSRGNAVVRMVVLVPVVYTETTDIR